MEEIALRQRRFLLLFIVSLSDFILLSSCILMEPKHVALTKRQKEDCLDIVLAAVNNPPEPKDAFSYRFYSETKDFDYRVYDNERGYILRHKNEKVFYKNGYMYNPDGNYKYKENVDFDILDGRVNVLKSAFVDLLNSEKADLYTGNNSVGIGGIQGTSLELILTDDSIDQKVFGESCIKVNASLYIDEEKQFKVASLSVFSENGIEEILSLGTSFSIAGDKIGAKYDNVYDWMGYPNDIDIYYESLT